MSDRGVFLAAFLTLVLVVAGAFAVPQFFVYELVTSIIFVVVAVMVFFGDDKFPYMLGIVAPILWIIFTFLTGELTGDFAALFRFLHGRAGGPFETPLPGFAVLTGLLLVALSARAWQKQVTEKFFGKTFAGVAVVSLVWVAVLFWQFHGFSTLVAPH
jgi:hypothetical protein